MNDYRRGVAYGVGAYLVWGVLPLFWPLLKPAGSVEILAHRFVWSLAVVLAILVVQRRWSWIPELVAQPRRLGLLAVAAVLIAVNWGTYIYGVNSGHVVESSLGYFINPLVTVLLGVAVLRERLRPVQWIALGIGALAIPILALSYGRPPWIALTLAFSFGLYGLIKKVLSMDAVQSLTAETAVLFVPALAYLLLLDGGTFRTGSIGHDALLVSSGLATAVPLLFFGAAARRIPLTVIGLLQYLAPGLQFLFGVLVFGEPMPLARLLGFALVWIALAVLSVDLVRRRRQRGEPAPELEPAAT